MKKRILFGIGVVVLMIATQFAGMTQTAQAAKKAKGSSKKNAVYVSASAKKEGNGTFEAPYKTIQQAIDSLKNKKGKTIYLRKGTYNEKVVFTKSGSKSKPIVITRYGKEKAVISGQKTDGAIISLNGQKYIQITNLEICNTSGFSHGILGNGGENNITIKNNKFHDLNVESGQDGSQGTNAVIFYCAKASANIVVDSNRIYNCRTGFSEAITFNGNVKNIKITNNTIENTTNIAIDVAGHYGACETTKYDQARNVVIKNNKIKNCVSKIAANAGIYSDGAKNVQILNNTVSGCPYGICAGAECPDGGYATSDITITGNKVSKCQYGALLVGGTQATVKNVTVSKNTLSTDNVNCPIYINKANNVKIKKNTLKTQGTSVVGNFYSADETKNVTFSGNTYYAGAKTAEETISRLYDEVFWGIECIDSTYKYIPMV
ncbi:MAG: right-handed parallel beta-helix repeat-containing protein [Lachnospiraceae bacterium]|nr:right-handed parallel beta-helix repeat-containing protein [Lachnospiraceae bacterium]